MIPTSVTPAHASPQQPSLPCTELVHTEGEPGMAPGAEDPTNSTGSADAGQPP